MNDSIREWWSDDAIGFMLFITSRQLVPQVSFVKVRLRGQFMTVGSGPQRPFSAMPWHNMPSCQILLDMIWFLFEQLLQKVAIVS